MKKEPYRVQGDAKQGLRIAVPTETGVKKGDRYDFEGSARFTGFWVTRDQITDMVSRDDILAEMTRDGILKSQQVPAGSLVYVPHVDDNAGTGGSGKKKVRK